MYPVTNVCVIYKWILIEKTFVVLATTISYSIYVLFFVFGFFFKETFKLTEFNPKCVV